MYFVLTFFCAGAFKNPFSYAVLDKHLKMEYFTTSARCSSHCTAFSNCQTPLQNVIKLFGVHFWPVFGWISLFKLYYAALFKLTRLHMHMNNKLKLINEIVWELNLNSAQVLLLLLWRKIDDGHCGRKKKNATCDGASSMWTIIYFNCLHSGIWWVNSQYVVDSGLFQMIRRIKCGLVSNGSVQGANTWTWFSVWTMAKQSKQQNGINCPIALHCIVGQ